MIERNRRDAGGNRINHIGRVKTAAQPHFQHHGIGAMARKGKKGRGGGDFEKGNWRTAIGEFAFLQRRGQLLFGNQPPGNPDPLMEMNQMRRGINVHAVSGTLQHRAQESADRTFSVGARDMDDRRNVAFRMAQDAEQPLHPVEHQIDPLRVQIKQPFQDGIAAGITGHPPAVPAVSGADTGTCAADGPHRRLFHQ